MHEVVSFRFRSAGRLRFGRGHRISRSPSVFRHYDNHGIGEVASAMDTIDYEVLTRLGARLDRRYSGGE